MEVGGGRGRLVLSRKPPRRPLHRFITVRLSQGQTAQDCFRPCHIHECGDLDMELDMDLAVAQLDHVQVHAQDLCRSLKFKTHWDCID